MRCIEGLFLGREGKCKRWSEGLLIDREGERQEIERGVVDG